MFTPNHFFFYFYLSVDDVGKYFTTTPPFIIIIKGGEGHIGKKINESGRKMTKLAPNNYKTPKTRFLPPTLKLDTQKENLRRIKRGEEEKKKKKKKKKGENSYRK